MIRRPPRSTLFPYTTLFRSFYVVMALLIVNSLGLATNFGLCSTIVQERAPDYLRGRVSAVFMLSFVGMMPDRKSTRLNSSHLVISYAVFCLKKKNITLTHRS